MQHMIRVKPEIIKEDSQKILTLQEACASACNQIIPPVIESGLHA